jgi:hypothetical protein
MGTRSPARIARLTRGVVAGIAVAALGSAAGAFDGVAPAGPCAQDLRGFRPPVVTSGGAAPSPAVTDVAGGPGASSAQTGGTGSPTGSAPTGSSATSVAIGAPRTRLTPTQVAAGPTSPFLGPAQPGVMRGVGPCDNPGSGCMGPVQVSPTAAAPAPAAVFLQQPGGQGGGGSGFFPGTKP